MGVSIPIGKNHYYDILVSLLISPLALGLLVMMYPILCKVRYETLHLVFKQRTLWVQIGFSVFMNWIVALLLMVSYSLSFRPGMNTADRLAWPCLGFSTRQERTACRIDLGRPCEMHRYGSYPLLSPSFPDTLLTPSRCLFGQGWPAAMRSTAQYWWQLTLSCKWYSSLRCLFSFSELLAMKVVLCTSLIQQLQRVLLYSSEFLWALPS